MINKRKKKSVHIMVHPDFYDKIEKERKSFMQKNNLTRLSTVAFTGVLGKGVIKKNVKKRKN